MYRYQTKPIGVNVGFNPLDTREMWLTFKQGDLLITLTKAQLAEELSAVEDKGNGRYRFTYTFTQEQSGSFSASMPIQAQVRWSNEEGHSDMTNVYSFWPKDVLQEGEI